MGEGSSIVTEVAWLAAEARLRPLTGELLCATGAAKKKKKKKQEGKKKKKPNKKQLVLVKVQRHKDLSVLLAGMCNGAAAAENSMAIPQKAKQRLTAWFTSNPTSM